MPEHHYWVEDGPPVSAMNMRGIPSGTPRMMVYLDPPRDGEWLRRTAVVLTYDEAKRLTRAIQQFLIRKEVGDADGVRVPDR